MPKVKQQREEGQEAKPWRMGPGLNFLAAHPGGGAGVPNVPWVVPQECATTGCLYLEGPAKIQALWGRL